MPRTPLLALLAPLLLTLFWLPPAAVHAVGPSQATIRPKALVAGLPVNLTHDAVRQNAPSVVRTAGGEYLVAWEQDLLTNRVTQQDIYFTSSSDGAQFSGPVNISNTPTKSHEPFLFRVNASDAYLLYQEMAAGTSAYRPVGALYQSPAWGPIAAVAPTLKKNLVDPVGVQASDGSIWLTGQIYLGGTATDNWVQQIGGPGFNLSNDGSAVRHPAIAAGENGQVYVAWIDHANEYGRPRRGINVMQWTGANWVALPVPSKETNIQWVNLDYFSGKVYVTWPSGAGVVGIKQVVWDGVSWGPITLVAPGYNITFLQTAISPGGSMFISWLAGGVAYLKKNADPPQVISGGLTSVKQLSVSIDDGDAAAIAFQQGSDIWFNTAQ